MDQELDIQGPPLAATSELFRCGYGPRALHRATKGDPTLFIGCKDGSVHQVRLTGSKAGKQLEPLCGHAETNAMVGARSIYDWDEDWLIIGHDSGDLGALRRGVEEKGKKIPLSLPDSDSACVGAITYVGRWGDLLLVSYRNSPVELYAVSADASPLRLERRREREQELAGVLALIRVVEMGAEERLLISKSGELWKQVGQKEPEPIDCWTRQERPAFIFDLTIAEQRCGATPCEAYLSTDQGVFRLYRDSGDFKVEGVDLSGFTGMCLAITHAVRRDAPGADTGHEFLWVSDGKGDVYLFWDNWNRGGQSNGRAVWRRSGIQQVGFAVTRALALWLEDGKKCVLGQICRNDRVAITEYEEKISTPSQILSWQSVKNFKASTFYVDRDREGWRIEAMIADFIEKMAESHPEELTKFLRNPGTELAKTTLEEMEGDEACQAVTLWTHTLIGAVHRQIRERNDQNYLGIVRWLRRLSETFTGSPALLASFEKNIQYTSKWGVFGDTYVARDNVFSALVPLQQNTADRQFDRLVYDSMLFQRKFNVDEEFSPSEIEGKSPSLKEERHTPLEVQLHQGYLAVSWAEKGVEIYDFFPAGEPRRTINDDAGSNRRIQLGSLDGRVYLLVANTPRPGADLTELNFALYWIDPLRDDVEYE